MDDLRPNDGPRAQSGTRCLSCGYDIVGVQIGGHCPECGSVVRQFAHGGQNQGKAIASLILGICALVMGCMTYGIVGLPCGILAVVFARQARAAVQAGTYPVSALGMATAGRVCGWIGIAISGLMLLLLLFYVLVMIGVFGAAMFGGGPSPFPVGP